MNIDVLLKSEEKTILCFLAKLTALDRALLEATKLREELRGLLREVEAEKEKISQSGR